MANKKLLAIFPFLVSIPLATAALPDSLNNLFNRVITFGNLGWLGYSDANIVLGLMRILLWFLIFTLFFAVMTGLGGEKGSAPMKFFGRKQAAIIAAIIATIAVIFIPPNILAATGAGWATLVALVLIGAPIVGIAFLLWKIPWEGEETKFTVFLKIVLCLLLFWILSAMKYHINALGVG